MHFVRHKARFVGLIMRSIDAHHGLMAESECNRMLMKITDIFRSSWTYSQMIDSNQPPHAFRNRIPKGNSFSCGWNIRQANLSDVCIVNSWDVNTIEIQLSQKGTRNDSGVLSSWSFFMLPKHIYKGFGNLPFNFDSVIILFTVLA